MTLSIAEKNKLEREYNLQLLNLIKKEKKDRFLEIKGQVVQFCVRENIQLYNIVQLEQATASLLLDELIELFAIPQTTLNSGQLAHLRNQQKQWKKQFEESLASVEQVLREEHAQAYLTVGDQLMKTGKVDPETMLTFRDMYDLLSDPKYKSEEIVLAKPFSFEEVDDEKVVGLKQFLANEKAAFLPIIHNNHWFYLLRDGPRWSIQDSQPINNDTLSLRQELIIRQTQVLLTRLDVEDECHFVTSGKQITNFDCGTQVVNAYRARVDADYIEKSHGQILEELVGKQVKFEDEHTIPDEEIAEAPESNLTKKEQDILETTVSVQSVPEKAILYKRNVTEIMAIAKQGFFTQVHNKIEIEHIDSAAAEAHETDEEFAIRLQEAEFRKAGLK